MERVDSGRDHFWCWCPFVYDGGLYSVRKSHVPLVIYGHNHFELVAMDNEIINAINVDNDNVNNETNKKMYKVKEKYLVGV